MKALSDFSLWYSVRLYWAALYNSALYSYQRSMIRPTQEYLRLQFSSSMLLTTVFD